MTNKERQYANLGIHYAEGIESVDKGYVYLGPKDRKFHFEFENDEYVGWFDDDSAVVYSEKELLDLFKLALNPPKIEFEDDGTCKNMWVTA